MSNTKTPKIEKKKLHNLVRGNGINLFPKPTEEQVSVEKTKSSLNINAAIAILFLVVATIGIIGYNMLSKLDLNKKKNDLFQLETNLNLRKDLISSNDEILRRIKLYQDIEQSTVSSKSVMDYWNQVSANLATINAIDITKGVIFSVSGQSTTLDDVSKLWYLLANDSRIKRVDLKTVSKDGNIVRFNFEGELNFDQFSKQQ